MPQKLVDSIQRGAAYVDCDATTALAYFNKLFHDQQHQTK